MNRRNFIKLASGFSLSAALPESPALAQSGEDTPTAHNGEAVFSQEWLIRQAENLAHQPFKQPPLNLPPELAKLDQTQYQAIEFKPELAVWNTDPLNFELQFFHTGFQYKVPVDIYLVDGDRARLYPYSPGQFNYGQPVTAPPFDSQSGFSGVRVHGTVNRPDAKDPFLTFQGASFFRALSSGQVFGLSARALSINTAQAAGEEFPFFRALYIKKPAAGERVLSIYALLDGASVTGAFKFLVEPGYSTTMDVECAIFPRKPLPHVGIASLSSMYFFGAADATRLDDYRPNVHSSDGLQIWNAGGEWIWRPLTNPEQLQYSVFVDSTPKGFGLLQRRRAFSDYEDIDGRFDDRPSLWVEPQGEWGEGAVDLIEVPSRSEIYDNIIAFWRPRSPLEEKRRYNFRYRLHWGWDPPLRSTLSYVAQTRIGGRAGDGARRIIIDFVSGHSCADCNLSPFTADIRPGDGEARNINVRHNPATGGQRVSFEYRPGGNGQTDLRCQLKQNAQVVSETWIYRWTN